LSNTNVLLHLVQNVQKKPTPTVFTVQMYLKCIPVIVVVKYFSIISSNNAHSFPYGLYLCNIYTTVFHIKRVNNRTRTFNRLTRKNHAISHLDLPILHGSLRVIKLQPRFKVCNISYLHVLFHTYILVYKPQKDQMKRMHSCYK
jgi:hypothetical protein